MLSNPTISTNTASGKFNNFYGTSVPFSSGGKNYIFAQTKTASNRWFITELKPDGSGFYHDTASGKFNNYYDTAISFKSGNKTYIFAQASASRRWFITELKPDGSGFYNDTASGKFNNFYGMAVPFTTGGKTYIFAQASESKRWFITELKPDGSGFYNDTASGKFNNFYGTAATFTAGEKTYIFAQTKTASNRWFITELKPDGSGFYNDTASGKFNNYYGTAVSFVSNNKPYIFAQTSTASNRWFIDEFISGATATNQDVTPTTATTAAASSANQSDLSNPKYGYDFVVATTQASINATMKEYLSGLTQPEVKICYIADANGNPTEISYAELMAQTDNTDPFTIPASANPATDPGIQKLMAARFMVGFQAQIGLPPGIAPQNMPDIVALGSNTASVTYNLMCAEFIVVQLVPGGGYNPASWMNEEQPAGDPWLFTSQVDLRLTNTADTAYGNLPPDVQKQIKNLGGNAFSVQQLLFDLDNAALQSVPTMSGVEPGTNLYMVLQKDFLGAYFTTMQANGEPMLGCTITQTTPPPSSLTLTDLNMNVNPYMGTNGQPLASPTDEQKDLATLNYLCAANGNPLPVASQFPWNWVEPSESADYHGVISTNAQTYAKWLSGVISPTLYGYSGICKIPKCSCWVDGVDVWYSLSYDYELTTQSFAIPETPVVDEDGFTQILTFYYYKSDSDKGGTEGLIWGNLSAKYTTQADVYVKGNQMKVITTVTEFVHVNFEGGVTEGNFAKFTTTDLFTFSVNESGTITTDYSSNTVDQSQNISGNIWSQIVSFGGIDDVIDGEVAYTKDSLTHFLEAYQANLNNTINGPQAWIFPGGETFMFKDVGFSDHQDLISHITYLQPS